MYTLIEPVDEIPKPRRGNMKLIPLAIWEFLKSDLKYARVKKDELGYRTIKSAYDSARQYVWRHKLPVKVHVVNYELYLEKIEEDRDTHEHNS